MECDDKSSISVMSINCGERECLSEPKPALNSHLSNDHSMLSIDLSECGTEVDSKDDVDEHIYTKNTVQS